MTPIGSAAKPRQICCAYVFVMCFHRFSNILHTPVKRKADDPLTTEVISIRAILVHYQGRTSFPVKIVKYVIHFVNSIFNSFHIKIESKDTECGKLLYNCLFSASAFVFSTTYTQWFLSTFPPFVESVENCIKHYVYRIILSTRFTQTLEMRLGFIHFSTF